MIKIGAKRILCKNFYVYIGDDHALSSLTQEMSNVKERISTIERKNHALTSLTQELKEKLSAVERKPR